MNSITKHLQVPIKVDQAFTRFVRELNEWWPREYSWSQNGLQRIYIDPRQDGLCTEIGPHAFRCDWGRVTEFVEPEAITFKWQISPQRVPEPNPDKASDVRVRFRRHAESATSLTLEHINFEHHGEGSEDYYSALDSPQGWDYLLDCYAAYCRQD